VTSQPQEVIISQVSLGRSIKESRSKEGRYLFPT